MFAGNSYPLKNQEAFQVLNYDVGQLYKVHNDYIPEMFNESWGVRVATFFLYLNNVEEGGGTGSFFQNCVF